MLMFRLILQLLLCGVAGVTLYRAWKRYVAPYPLGLIVTLGLLLRAVCGQVLFWLSYLRLPLGRSLQTGDGLWFFALDARMYLDFAYGASEAGFQKIFLLPHHVASVTFVQALAIFAHLFGSVASVGLLLNLVAYLGACAIVLRAAQSSADAGNPHAMRAGAVTLMALSFAPSAVLWALQPLKDTFVQFLIVSFVAGIVLWQRAWTSDRGAKSILAAALVMGGTLYAVTGIRWYLGFILLASTFAFMAFVSASVERRRLVSISSSLVLFILLTQIFRLSGGAYVPPPLQGVLHPATFAGEIRRSPLLIAGLVERARTGFEHSGGATTIRAASRRPAPQPAAKPPAAMIATPPQVASRSHVAGDRAPKAATAPALAKKDGSTEPRASAKTAEASTDSHSATDSEPVLTTSSVSDSQRASDEASADDNAASPAQLTDPPTPQGASEQPAGTDVQQTATAATVTETQGPNTPAMAADAAKTSSEASPSTIAVADEPRGERVDATAKTKQRVAKKNTRAVASHPTVPTPLTRSVPAVATTPTAAPVVQPRRIDAMPYSRPEQKVAPVGAATRMERLRVGVIALVVPQTLAGRLGLIEVGGGRGFMWFADVDTLIFDALLLCSLFLIVRRFDRTLLRNHALWLVVLTGAFLAVPLVYTVSNFGTLFRLRLMIFTICALVPVVIELKKWRSPSTPSDADLV